MFTETFCILRNFRKIQILSDCLGIISRLHGWMLCGFWLVNYQKLSEFWESICNFRYFPKNTKLSHSRLFWCIPDSFETVLYKTINQKTGTWTRQIKILWTFAKIWASTLVGCGELSEHFFFFFLSGKFVVRTGDWEIPSVSGGVAISGLEPICILNDTTQRLTRRL